MNKDSKISVAGSRGLVGSAIVRELKLNGYTNLLCPPRSELNLLDPVAVKWFFSVYEPEYVFLAAARVGGIIDNSKNLLQFFLENMAITTNVITNAADYGVKKLLFLGSNCIYPRDCPQPIKEEYLLTGSLEKTNEAYALAKISGVKLCEWFRAERGCNFVSAMPCNLFGPFDSFNGQTAHIIPGLISRMHAAKINNEPEFEVWGDGTARREFLYSRDLASALLLIMREYNDAEPINTGSGLELTVSEIAYIIKELVKFSGRIKFDTSKPAGTPRKILDNSKIFKLGWFPQTNLKCALQETYKYFLSE